MFLDQIDHAQKLTEHYCLFLLLQSLKMSHQDVHLGARPEIVAERYANPIFSRQRHVILLTQDGSALWAVSDCLNGGNQTRFTVGVQTHRNNGK